MLLKIFFQIIVNSQAVVKNDTERFCVPHSQFPSVRTSCKIIVQQYHNQNKAPDLFQIPPILCVFICVFVCVFYVFLSHV